MANHEDVIKALLQTFSAPGAGIDIPQFREDFLPQAPTPPTTTLQDPTTNRGNALAVFGAGLAQPIQSNQSFQGNTANAALAGLDVIGQQRTQENDAAQTLFDNQITQGQLQREQGQALTSASLANAQRDYYNGLIVNAGLEDLLTGEAENDEFMRQVAKDAAAMAKNIMELAPDFFGQDLLDRIYITPDQLYADTLRNLHSVLGVGGSPLQVQAEIMRNIGEQVKYLEMSDDIKERLGIDLPANPQEFFDNREKWEGIVDEAQNIRLPGSGITSQVDAARTALAETTAQTKAGAEIQDILNEAGIRAGEFPEVTRASVQSARAYEKKLSDTFPTKESLAQFSDSQQALLFKAFENNRRFIEEAEESGFKQNFSRQNPQTSIVSNPNPSTSGVATRFSR